MNGFPSLPTPISSPDLLQSINLDDSLSNNSSPTHGQVNNGPSRDNPSHLRAAQSWLSPPSDTEADSRVSSPEPHDENWSSAVGRATTGKSGRVIERLMAENDRLRRELNMETSARKELQRQLDTSKPVTDTLKEENSNLVAMRASDESALARRQRKIEELKSDLEEERRRRETAEKRANEMVRLREEGAVKAEREVGDAAERARYATVQAEILEGSHKQLRNEYRQRAETLARGIQEATAARKEDKGRLQRLDVVLDQMRQELERANRVNEELRGLVEEYGRESERRVRQVGEDAEEKDREGKRLREEMTEVVEKMRWVMGVEKNRGAAS